MLRTLTRALAVLPIGLALLLPTTASASTGPSIVLDDTATRAGLSLVLPVQITCDSNNMFFGFPTTAQIHVVQANGNSSVAVGVGNLGNNFGPPMPGSGPQINCNGLPNTYNVLIAPDLQTDPYTASFSGGRATASGSLTTTTLVTQCFPWGCFQMPVQQTISVGPQTMHIKG